MGQIDMMIEGLAVARHGKDDPTDSIPAFGEKPKVTRAGDLWVLGRQRVYCEARNDSVAEEDETHVIQTPYGAQRFERRTGEALHAEREALELLNRIRETRLLRHLLKGELRLLRNSRINQRDQQRL
jgi:hypothetical protein